MNGRAVTEDDWSRRVLQRTDAIAWLGLSAILAYCFVASDFDRQDHPLWVSGALLALFVLASRLTFAEIRSPWSPQLSAHAQMTAVVFSATTLGVLSATALSAIVLFDRVGYQADATLVLLPLPFAWWAAVHAPSRFMASVVLFVGGLLALWTAWVLPLSNDAVPDAHRIMVVRAIEGAVAVAVSALLIREIGRMLVRWEILIASSLRSRIAAIGAERSLHTERIGVAVQVELEARPLRATSVAGAKCARCKRIAEIVARSADRIDRWEGQDVLELGMVIRRARRLRGRYGMTVHYQDEARLDGAIFVKEEDFAPVARFIGEFVLPDPAFIHCTLARTGDDVRITFRGRVSSARWQHVDYIKTGSEPSGEAKAEAFLRAVGQSSVEPVADDEPWAPSWVWRILQYPRVGTFGPLLVVLLVAICLDVPATWLQITMNGGALWPGALLTGVVLLGLAAYWAVVVNRDEGRLFSPLRTVRWLLTASFLIVVASRGSLGAEFFRGIGYPQPFARYLLFMVVLVVVTNRIVPDGLYAWLTAASAFVWIAIVSGHLSVLASSDGVRAISWWPYWLVVALLGGALIKRGLREMEDISVRLADDMAQEEVVGKTPIDDVDIHQIAVWASRELGRIRDEVSESAALSGCTTCEQAVQSFNRFGRPGVSLFTPDAASDEVRAWVYRMEQLAKALKGKFGTVSSRHSLTVRISERTDPGDDRLRTLVERYTASLHGWVTWDTPIAATIPSERDRRRLIVDRTVEDV